MSSLNLIQLSTGEVRVWYNFEILDVFFLLYCAALEQKSNLRSLLLNEVKHKLAQNGPCVGS